MHFGIDQLHHRVYAAADDMDDHQWPESVTQIDINEGHACSGPFHSVRGRTFSTAATCMM
jgi:hypothetical protein